MEQEISREQFNSLGCKLFFDGYNCYACRRGISHEENHIVCQDACLCGDAAEGLFVSAVADGHDGAEFDRSDLGARFACEQIIAQLVSVFTASDADEDAFIRNVLSPAFRSKFLHRWRWAVLEHAAAHAESNTKEDDSNTVRRYSTTLLFAAVTKHRLLTGQLGSGGILLFHPSGDWQLQHRNALRFGNTSISAASAQAQYAFQISAYSRSRFNHILLSTDGIFNTLNARGFCIYATELVQRAEQGDFAQKPFLYTPENSDKGYDLFTRSKDDCTVSLICFSDQSADNADKSLKPHHFSSYGFERSYASLECYSAVRHALPFDIHVFLETPRSLPELPQIPNVIFLTPVERFTGADDKQYAVYPHFDDIQEISALIEAGAHLERPYFSSADLESEYPMRIWMLILERLVSVQNALKALGFQLSERQIEMLSVNPQGKLLIYCDGFADAKDPHASAAMRQFRSMFAIIGKLSHGETEIPLFAPNPHGQTVPTLSRTDEGVFRPLCRTEKSILHGIRLRNISDYPWEVSFRNGHTITVPAGRKITLTNSQIIRVVTQDGPQEYAVELF